MFFVHRGIVSKFKVYSSCKFHCLCWMRGSTVARSRCSTLLPDWSSPTCSLLSGYNCWFSYSGPISKTVRRHVTWTSNYPSISCGCDDLQRSDSFGSLRVGMKATSNDLWWISEPHDLLCLTAAGWLVLPEIRISRQACARRLGSKALPNILWLFSMSCSSTCSFLSRHGDPIVHLSVVRCFLLFIFCSTFQHNIKTKKNIVRKRW